MSSIKSLATKLSQSEKNEQHLTESTIYSHLLKLNRSSDIKLNKMDDKEFEAFVEKNSNKIFHDARRKAETSTVEEKNDKETKDKPVVDKEEKIDAKPVIDKKLEEEKIDDKPVIGEKFDDKLIVDEKAEKEKSDNKPVINEKSDKEKVSESTTKDSLTDINENKKKLTETAKTERLVEKLAQDKEKAAESLQEHKDAFSKFDNQTKEPKPIEHDEKQSSSTSSIKQWFKKFFGSFLK